MTKENKPVNKKPELLSPAGNFEKLTFALSYGADAVYLAGEEFGMRSAAGNFTNDELIEASKYVRSSGKRFYITVNTLPRDDEFHKLKEFLNFLREIKPDAVIVADLGVFALCRRLLPETDIHISTQGAVVNSESCRIWHEMGAKRIVLARELTLDEIKRIRDNVPETLELEVFIHGAMCVSISGRCLLSEYYVDRDANRGKCAQPCRWIYNFAEEKRPDDILTGEVHREGTYLFGSKDMNLIRHIDELCDSGIDCFKIEGRMKSAYYAAVTANAYHIAIDAHNSSQPADIDALALELDGVSHREYCTGYFFDHPYLNSQLADKPGYIRESSFLATIDRFDPETHTAFCTQKNKMYSGFPAELLTPGKTGVRFIAGEMRDSEGCIIDASPHPQMKYSVRFPDDFPFTPKTGDIIRAAQC